MALSDKIAAHFQSNVFWGGLTYNAHPMCLAAALAAVEVLVDEGMVENSAKMGEVMHGHMARLAKKHKSVREHRNIGLFGLIELRKNAKNERLVPYAGSHPVMPKLAKFFKDNGLFTAWEVKVLPSLYAVNPSTKTVIPVAFGVTAMDEMENRIMTLVGVQP
jgi:taurine--2-oxoglutarate transaminase